MWLIHIALRRPITILVLVVALALSSVLAIMRTRVDIFPNLDLPVIYVAQPYGGMSPQQMEGFVSYYYEYHFLYINGIESVEAKSIQGTALLRLSFYPGTNMSDALAQTISYVNRARASMPPGTVSPFVIRYDTGTLPVGYMVFSSPSRTLAEIQDLALNRVRPVFATLPGVSSPPPFGGNQRTIVINVDPQKLQAYGLSPEKVVQALTSGNSIQPAGNADIGTTHTLVTTDSTVTQITDLLNIPLKLGSGGLGLHPRHRKCRGFVGPAGWICTAEWETHHLHPSHQKARRFDAYCCSGGPGEPRALPVSHSRRHQDHL
jgi:multidrug efflux pump subunit AcrB